MKPRILIWDIEASSLNADYGAVLCVGFKWLSEPTSETVVLSTMGQNGVCSKCDRIVDPGDDKKLLQLISPILSSADGWVTWFGEFFDQRFVNTRLLHHKLPPLPPVPHIDGWRTARYQMRLSSNRLKTVEAFFGLPDAKTRITPQHWIDALNGHKSSMDYIKDHCRKDVIVLEKAYKRLLPLIKHHPNYNLFSGKERAVCANCGGKVQYRGVHRTHTREYHRYQCVRCGKWGREGTLSKSVSGRNL